MRSTDAATAQSGSPETIQKHVLGGILVVLLPICIGLLMGKLGTHQSKAALAAGVATGLIALAILLSQSHGAVLAVISALMTRAAVRIGPLRVALAVNLLVAGVVVWFLNLGP